MCGIAAAVDTERPERARPWALGALRHRGPDGEGIAGFPGAALEHCRLAIIDPENRQANQPFTDASGRWTLIYNGELFNYRELRLELSKQGVRFRTDCDTEVVLACLIRYGPGSLRRFRGMFALAVWDNERRELLAARDHVGVKPLYYFCTGSLLLIASEVRPFLQHPEVPRRLDTKRAFEFLAFGHSFGDSTIVDGIMKLEPGHFLRYRGGKLRVERFWDALPVGTGTLGGQELAAEDLAEVVASSIQASVTSDVPIGLMLSGGIDSTAIAVHVARFCRPDDVTSYSVGFGLPDDETSAASRLAAELGFRHRVISLSNKEFESELDPWVRGLDYPTANPTALAVSAIARAAQRDGVKVLLSGDGGDELFGGYTRWMKYLRAHDWVWSRIPPRALRAGGRLAAHGARGLGADIATRAATGREFFVPSRPFHDDLLKQCVASGVPPNLANAIAYSSFDEVRSRYEQLKSSGDYLSWMSYAALKTYLVNDYLQRLDTMGMQHSVEGRVPLLDPILVEHAFRIPQRSKVGHYKQKSLFRAAMDSQLPSYIKARPKQGFCPPIGGWAGQLRDTNGGDRGLLWDAGLLHRDTWNTIASRGRDKPFATWTLAVLSAWVNKNLTDAAAPR
jgi:asparagine synthase (glutamine-hydrolysing)